MLISKKKQKRRYKPVKTMIILEPMTQRFESLIQESGMTMTRYEVPPIRHPLRQLSPVPIDMAYLDAITTILNAHGATLVEVNQEGTAFPRQFTITFPEGTVRVYDLSLSRSVRFTIYFPDGYAQLAAELWPLARSSHDRPITVLYLPRDEGGPHAALS